MIDKDHPHAYGDKPCKDPAKSATIGSSPRVWGQDIVLRVGSKIIRIIPTRMGTRNDLAVNRRSPWDHPHAYGDKCCHMPTAS